MDALPDLSVSVRQLFGIDTDMLVPAFSDPAEHVPILDESYCFDPETTLAILAGFAYNRRVLIQGYHGTGKSTHINQVATRLNWPCIRVNLDSHISRIDLIGKDAIVVRDGIVPEQLGDCVQFLSFLWHRVHIVFAPCYRRSDVLFFQMV